MLNYLIFFLLGYAIGKAPFILEYIKVRAENKELKKDVTVLKKYIHQTNRGRVIRK